MNKHIFYLVLVGVLSVGSLALAEDGANRLRPEDRVNANMPKPSVLPSPSIRVKAQEQKDQLKQDVKNVRNDVKEDIKKRKEEFNNTVKEKRTELDNEIKTKREELKVRLEKIKDERKKQTVERIDQRIDALNEKMMKHFSDVLDKLERMLVRISERADKASLEKGLDVSSVRSAIDKANTAIASARLAIEAQSGKTYAIKVTTESTLKIDVGKARQALNADLAKVRDLVKAAQSAVKDAAVALAQIVGKKKVLPTVLTPTS